MTTNSIFQAAMLGQIIDELKIKSNQQMIPFSRYSGESLSDFIVFDDSGCDISQIRAGEVKRFEVIIDIRESEMNTYTPRDILNTLKNKFKGISMQVQMIDEASTGKIRFYISIRTDDGAEMIIENGESRIVKF